MSARVPAPLQETLPVPRYQRPSRLRRAGLIAVGAAGAIGVACGGGDDSGSAQAITAEEWVQTDGATGRINMDDVEQAYKDAYRDNTFDMSAFEQRVNEIYEGDNLVMVTADQQSDKVVLSGWEDLDGDKTIADGTDDKLFTITQTLQDNGQYEVQGHGANNYYYHSSPFSGFLMGWMIGSLFWGGGPRYMTPSTAYDSHASSRTAYRNSAAYGQQRDRNLSYGSSAATRFGSAATSQPVSPARSSYQSRQVNSGGFRSSSSGTRSIGSGGKVGSVGSGGGLSGGGGMLRL